MSVLSPESGPEPVTDLMNVLNVGEYSASRSSSTVESVARSSSGKPSRFAKSPDCLILCACACQLLMTSELSGRMGAHGVDVRLFLSEADMAHDLVLGLAQKVLAKERVDHAVLVRLCAFVRARELAGARQERRVEWRARPCPVALSSHPLCRPLRHRCAPRSVLVLVLAVTKLEQQRSLNGRTHKGAKTEAQGMRTGRAREDCMAIQDA